MTNSASHRRFAVCLAAALAIVAGAAAAQEGQSGHALSMYGDVKYPADFKQFDYVNADAPKGGEAHLAAIGTYDSLNGFILKGVPAVGLGFIYDTLMTGSADEAFTQYCLLCESVDMPADRSWVAFTLRPEARWHDGQPITVEDVIFTFETLTKRGNPFFRSYYGNVVKAEKTDERTVRFSFRESMNRELPLIIGQMAVLPRHYWLEANFDETTLTPPLGSGPYKIDHIDPGRSISYRRVADYWGKDLPVNLGRNNFDVLRFDYYRDATVAIEALKARQYDLRDENIAKEWATAYDIDALKDGFLVKDLVGHQIGTGMQGYVLNSRREIFKDPQVRRALAYAFDFEWTNANLFYGQYTRTSSYYSNTELASTGLPEGKELAILEPYRGRVPDEVFTQSYLPPATDGTTAGLRKNLLTAQGLLKRAGWEIKNNQLSHGPSGAVMQFEILLASPAFERVVGPFVQNLKRLGVDASIRTVDAAQYQKREEDFDFDVIVNSWGQSLSPGNEQRDFWSSAAADTPGSSNLAGIKDPVVDALIEQLIAAPDRETLIATTRALDRVLLWGHYVIPNWHIRSFRLVYWDMFGKPKITPKYGGGFDDRWWFDADKFARLDRYKPRARGE